MEFSTEIRCSVNRISTGLSGGFLIDGYYISDEDLHAGHVYSLLVTAMISAPTITVDGGMVHDLA